MKPLGLLCIALAAHAAGAEPAPQFAASIQIFESEPGAVARGAKTGAVIFFLRVALPAEHIFPSAAKRPLNAAIAFWPAAKTGERQASGAHPLGTEPREVTVSAVIPGPGDYLASLVVFSADGRPVAESTPTKFTF